MDKLTWCRQNAPKALKDLDDEDLLSFMEESYNKFVLNYKIPIFEPKTEVYNISNSKGNQRKWYIKEDDIFVKEQFFYQEKFWKDYLVEVIATKLCEQLPKMPFKFAEYKPCKIKTNIGITNGCYSKNFLSDCEELLTFKQLANSQPFTFFEKWLTSKKLESIFYLLYSVSNSDWKLYFAYMFLIDYLVYNEDRHLNNIAVCVDIHTRVITPAPLFDFGLGLLESDEQCANYNLDKVLTKIKYKPYGVKFESVRKVYEDMTPFKTIIPKSLNISNFEFPSYKGKVLFKYQCSKLGIEVKEDS